MRLSRPVPPDRGARWLRELALPDTLDLQTLQAVITERRARPLFIEPMPDAGADRPFGAWIARENLDVVYYEPATSPAHRAHIVLHEMAHILCGHTPMSWSVLFPDIDERVITAMFRHDYTDEAEKEAELLALVLHRRIELTAAKRRTPDAMRRAFDALAHPRVRRAG